MVAYQAPPESGAVTPLDGEVEQLAERNTMGSSAIDNDGPERPVSDALVDNDTLAQLLATHVRTARMALGRPLPPIPEQTSGFLESLSVDQAGRIWITGWMVDDEVTHRPAIILDAGKHAAAMRYALVRRPDLPSGHVGFVGLLHSRWRPTSTVAPSLLMADDDSVFLEPLLPTPVRTHQANAPLIAQYLARSEGQNRDELRDLFHLAPTWAVPNDTASADWLHIDEVAILPGFGAFVSGWVLSPTNDAEGFTLKVGNRVIDADTRSLSRHDRPDLLATYPNMADAIGSAGFVAIFRDVFEPDELDELIVKVSWSDGSSTNGRVLSNTIRIFGLTMPLDGAYRYYPELEAEHFFSDFARCAALNARDHARHVRGYEVQATDNVLILAAPASSSDLFLMYDNALRYAGSLPPSWGIAIVAEPDRMRALTVSSFAHLSWTTARRCSLFFTRRGRPSSDAIETMTDTLSATRFAFVAAGVSLTRDGWAAIGRAGEGLTLLAVQDPALPGSPASGSLDAFVCETATWHALLRDAAPRIGGIALGPDTAESGSAAPVIVPDAAIRLGNRTPTKLITRINDALGHQNG